jgi:hypothetical protein
MQHESERNRAKQGQDDGRTITTALLDRSIFESAYAGQTPWDIGRPNKALVEIADRIAGSALDAGCGTGENALFFAGRDSLIQQMIHP